MPRHVGDHLYSVTAEKSEGPRAAYKFRNARELRLPERFFRDAIAAEPELVIGPCRGSELVDEDETWRWWATEQNVRGIGSIDVLLLSTAGRIGIVETKLATNPERRREVLAQVLDYAAHLPRVGMEGLPDVPEGFADPEDVARHVAERDYLLVIAGDELEDRMASLSAVLLGKHLIHPWSLALVELSPYATVQGVSGPEILLVPSLRKAVIAESRNVVRIDTRRAQYEDNRVTVNVSFNIEEADLESSGVPAARKAMTEEEFWTRLRTQPAETVASVENLVAFGERLGLVKRWGAGSMIFDLPQAGASPPLEGVFFIRRGGEVVVWPNTLEGRLRRLGIQLDTARYRDAVVEALRCPPDRREPSGKLDEHGLEVFKEATAAFVAEIRSKLARAKPE